MELEDIKKLPLSSLLQDLPNIVSSFSASIFISKGRQHRWNRMRNRKVNKNAIIPNVIEEYIINEIKNIDKYLESKITIPFLIKNNWYISYSPFETAIMELINIYIAKNKNRINKNTVILIDNLRRNKTRPFDVFYAGDLIWLLGIYFNTLIKDSKLITYRNKDMESNFPQNIIFPINYNGNIIEINEFDIFHEINNHFENDCIIYITKLLGNYYGYFDRLEAILDKDMKKPTIIVWELRPCYKINPEKYTINYLQGFTESNFIKMEKIISHM